MNPDNKRIFIVDLPPTSTKEELESSFSKYGQVSSIEIKERKELGPKNKSPFFAYINLCTDDKGLNSCFQDLSGTKWHGQFVQLQMARESFLDRLKRERQEAEAFRPETNSHSSENHIKPSPKPKFKSPPEESDIIIKNNSHSLENDIKPAPKPKIESPPESPRAEQEELDIIIKNNRHKLNQGGALKIPSLGKAPIVEITKTKHKPSDTQANIKRLQSLQNMKKGYAAQKSLIQSALSYGNSRPNNKIVFDDPQGKTNGVQKQKSALFQQEESEGESDFEADFTVKEQFQGKSGQKLLELQSKFKNDKRFALDERFLDEQPEDNNEEVEDDLEAEKKEQIKILEAVLGKRVSGQSGPAKPKKAMVKFDPSHPEHSKLEMTHEEPPKKKKKKTAQTNEEPEMPQAQPEISKEVFYKVPDNLKETLTEKGEFSLLSMFGKAKEDDSTEKQPQNVVKELKKSKLIPSQNPFKYDSSDEEEEEEENIPHMDAVAKAPQSSEPAPLKASQAVFWTEPFFFKNDDFRLQEGLDFIEKIKTEDKEFVKMRGELKGIVKAKVRNNERKNKMFKKKLGGSKRRKHIRIKKALKR